MNVFKNRKYQLTSRISYLKYTIKFERKLKNNRTKKQKSQFIKWLQGPEFEKQKSNQFNRLHTLWNGIFRLFVFVPIFREHFSLLRTLSRTKGTNDFLGTSSFILTQASKRDKHWKVIGLWVFLDKVHGYTRKVSGDLLSEVSKVIFVHFTSFIENCIFMFRGENKIIRRIAFDRI